MKTVADVIRNQNNFDFIRFLAAVGVAFSHSYPATQGANTNEPLHVFSGGHTTIGEVCVAVFFVISGFLISQSFIRSTSTIEYFVNRAVRIIPGLLVVTLIVGFVYGPLVTSKSVEEYWTSYTTWRYLGNAFVYPTAQRLPGVFEHNTYPFVTNASTWTLSYEFTCYLLVAVAGMAHRRLWLASALVGVVALLSIFYTHISPTIFMGFAAYFLAGSIAFIARRHILLDARIFLFSIVILPVLLMSKVGGVIGLSIFGTYAVLFLGYSGAQVGTAITRHGDFSYGVYLYAWPIQQTLSSAFSSPAMNFLATLPLVLLFGYFSWALIERPAMSRRKAWARVVRDRLSTELDRRSRGRSK